MERSLTKNSTQKSHDLVPHIVFLKDDQKSSFQVECPNPSNPPLIPLNTSWISPYNNEPSSPKKGSFSQKKSLFGSLFKKTPISIINNQESKLLKEKLSNLGFSKRKSLKSSSWKQSIHSNSKIKSKETESNNYLWIIFYVKKFISILKVNVLLKKLAKMKNFHYQIIGDKTHFNNDLNILYSIMRENNPLYQNEILKKTIVDRLKEEFLKSWSFLFELLARIEVFQPDKFIVSIWNLIMLLFVSINALYIPLKIGFEIEESQVNNNVYIVFEQIPVWIFIFDIFLTLNTAYYSKGVYIIDRFKIIKHYVKTFLLLDIVTIGPFILGKLSAINYIETLFMLRILKLKASVRKLEEFLQLSDLYGGKFQLFKLMGLIFYLAHISCCAWNYLASVEISYGSETTWLDLLGIRGAGWQVKYVNSLYYSIVTMVTVGYGDVTPQNSIEKIFSIGYIGMACGVFAYGVNEVGTILKEMYKSENDFKLQFFTMMGYMKSRGLNKVLQLRVRKYLEYMHEENKFGYKNGDLLLTSLSSKLRQEVLMDIYGKILKEYQVFSSNFSPGFLKRISLKMREMTFAPDDIIIEEHEIDDKSLYFILKGEVECFQTLKGDNLQRQMTFRLLKKGESFGAFSFFTDERRESSVKSVNITHIACLSKHDFLETLKDFPDDFEKFRMLVDLIKVYSRFSELGISCASCGELDHLSRRCDLITYKPIPLKIIKVFQENSSQNRRALRRRNRKSFNSGKDAMLVDERASRFIQEMAAEVEEHHFKYLALESEVDESSSNSDSNHQSSDEPDEKKDEVTPPLIKIKAAEGGERRPSLSAHSPERKSSADCEFFSKRLAQINSKSLSL